MILEGFPVDRVDLFGRPHPLVEALACLVPQPAALDHLLHEFRYDESVAPRIARNRVLEIARDVSPYIQPHDVQQAITGAVGKADQRPGERVDFFDRVLVFYRDPLDRSPEEAADPVGDEVGCVLTTNNSFAQMN